jgi:hypothetical protein
VSVGRYHSTIIILYTNSYVGKTKIDEIALLIPIFSTLNIKQYVVTNVKYDVHIKMSASRKRKFLSRFFFF